MLGETREIPAGAKAFGHGGFQPPDRCAKRTGKNERMTQGKALAFSLGSSSFFLCPEAEAACAHVSSSSRCIQFVFLIQAISPAEVQEENPPGSGVWGLKKPPTYPPTRPSETHGQARRRPLGICRTGPNVPRATHHAPAVSSSSAFIFRNTWVCMAMVRPRVITSAMG